MADITVIITVSTNPKMEPPMSPPTVLTPVAVLLQLLASFMQLQATDPETCLVGAAIT